MEQIIETIGFERYLSYKDTGVEWLGEVPEGWEIVRMKRLFRDVSLKNKPNAELLSVTQDKGVVPRSWVENRMVMPSGALQSFKFINKGDFAISLRSFEGGLEYCHHDGIISPAYTVLKATRIFASQFYKYLFKSASFISELQTSVVGIREGKNISYEELCYSFLPIPSFNEQAAIANFLDRKIAQIDLTIEQKEKQIELLKERRQILVHKIVTRGLREHIPLKDSCIDWIGEIPEHWQIKKLKYLLIGKLKYGANESGVEYNFNMPRYIRITDFGQDGRLSEDNKLSLSWKQGGNYLLKDGDILFARSGATVGKTYQFKKSMSIEKNYCYAGYLIKAEANEALILSDFLYLYTSSPLFNKWKDGIFIKATIENIGADKYSQLPVIVPPVAEQQKLLDKFQNWTMKISNAISCKENEIEKLKEYKATLINSAVTGKIKVS
jgi:type I restriction enzyme S subunit